MGKFSNTYSSILFAFLILLLTLSCQEDKSDNIGTGDVIAHLVWANHRTSTNKQTKEEPVYATLPDTVTTIRGIVSGADMSDCQKDFDVSLRSGVIDNIPAGSNRTVTMQGLDSAGSILYQGVATSITIAAGQTTDAGTIEMTLYDYKAITAFSFTTATNSALSSDVTATISGTDITAIVPSGTDKTALVATFTTTGESVTVSDTKQVSGTTANDFSSAVTYTVTATDSSTQDYTITVTAYDSKEITAFSFTAAANTALSTDVTATISGTNITATVPYGTTVTALAATYTTTGSSVSVEDTAQVSGTTANDFGSPVTYTVTAADSSTQDYTVTVTVAFPAGYSVIYTTSVPFTMVSVPGGLTFKTGTDDNGTATVSDAYLIGQTEVTYELWYAVYTWANLNGYTFANAGKEGHDGTIGAASTNQEPVTTINWRDSMVWMNALTEYYNAQKGTGLTAVYTYTGSIIRNSEDSNGTACDNAVASSTADGFRLVSSDEWELAARYINDANSDGDIKDTNEYYPGSYASGATADFNDAAATGLVAVYNGSATAVVKSKTSNALGIYDMNGNVQEWVNDRSGTQPSDKNRIFRGGSYDASTGSLVQLGRTNGYEPYLEYWFIGFRFAKTQ
jgi:formylglycine-generating enzyme required for sulfatase activity